MLLFLEREREGKEEFLERGREREKREAMERGRGRVSTGMLPLLAIHVANEYLRSSTKPPVTAGLLLANALVYLRPGPLDTILPTIDEASFNSHLIVKNKDMKRFFLSAFYHVGESHLFYNMLSLLWKGVQLENAVGSVEFASMVATLLGMSQGITLLMTKFLHIFFDYEVPYYRHHAVGFSGVLFALKVVLNSQSDNDTYVHGLIVPSRYAAWAELLLIQIFMPEVYFLGHLGGIFAGLLYLWMKHTHSGPNPLTELIRKIGSLVIWPVRFLGNLFQFRRNRMTGRGRVGGAPYGRGISGVWRCSTCTHDNPVWNDVCEMCSTERADRGFSVLHTSHQPQVLSLEELRRRRLERYS